MGGSNSKKPKLKVPYCHTENEDKGDRYELFTMSEHIICEYTGLNFNEIAELDIVEYCLYRREGYIAKLRQTESGRDYLEKCWYLEQTKADKSALRKFLRG